MSSQSSDISLFPRQVRNIYFSGESRFGALRTKTKRGRHRYNKISCCLKLSICGLLAQLHNVSWRVECLHDRVYLYILPISIVTGILQFCKFLPANGLNLLDRKINGNYSLSAVTLDFTARTPSLSSAPQCLS